jgi:hypothetical protein
MSLIIHQALELAKNRGIFPTNLSASEVADLALTLESRAFWSARTTQAGYLRGLKTLVERYVQSEGLDNDLAQLRIEARRLLAMYGYTPETGFPGDAKRGIPAATPGTLTDLGSERRLNLIYDTQAKLARGLGLKLRGLDRIDLAPAWELVRVESRETPREWLKRWAEAADNIDQAGVYEVPGRMIAHKESPIWAAVGSRALFDDALNVDHPPFAFQSGMGWREVFASDLAEFEMAPLSAAGPAKSSSEVPDFVDPEDFIGGQATIDGLLAKWRARR